MTAELEGLNGGWPFGPGPDQVPWYVGYRGATETGSQAAGIHGLCGWCDQSFVRLGHWTHTWEALKSHLALHVMQVHSDRIVG